MTKKAKLERNQTETKQNEQELTKTNLTKSGLRQVDKAVLFAACQQLKFCLCLLVFPMSPKETAPPKKLADSPFKEENDEEQETESAQGGLFSPSGLDPFPDLPEEVPKLPDDWKQPDTEEKHFDMEVQHPTHEKQ